MSGGRRAAARAIRAVGAGVNQARLRSPFGRALRIVVIVAEVDESGAPEAQISAIHQVTGTIPRMVWIAGIVRRGTPVHVSESVDEVGEAGGMAVESPAVAVCVTVVTASMVRGDGRGPVGSGAPSPPPQPDRRPQKRTSGAESQ